MTPIELQASRHALNLTNEGLAQYLGLSNGLIIKSLESEVTENMGLEIERLLKRNNRFNTYERLVAVYKQLEKQESKFQQMDQLQLSLMDKDEVLSMIFGDDVVEDILTDGFDLSGDELSGFIEEYELRDAQHAIADEIIDKSDEISSQKRAQGDLFEELFYQAAKEESDVSIYVKFCKLARKALKSKFLDDSVNIWFVEQNEMKSYQQGRKSIKSLCYDAFCSIEMVEDRMM
ncbi:hypothetical protein CTH30272_02845 [Allocatenococcus thiocycli]|nr:hypothetical protein CTH30272_02845 [Catenococcus thiocycli]